MTMPQGIDVSHWNGAIDWPKAAADGVQFAYIKATQGTSEDPMFSTYATQASAAGILTLAYPFVTATDDEACIDKFNSVVGDMAAVLDCEVAGIAEPVSLWIAGMAAAKRPTLAYIGISPPFVPPAEIWTLPRILPEYTTGTLRLPAWDGMSAPNWETEWLIWQSTDRETFAGETGNFDLDILAIDLDRFERWCASGTFPLPAVTGTPLPPPAQEPVPVPEPDHPTIKIGATGPAVTLLQQKLGIPADGNFGPLTKAAVVKFQNSKGLGADGVVGPLTWAALG